MGSATASTGIGLLSQPAEHLVQVLREEHVVLEEAERPQADDDDDRDDPGPQPRADSGTPDEPPARVVHHRHAEHQQDEPGVPPAVEDVAGDEQEGVEHQSGALGRRPDPPAQALECVVEQEHQRQEVEDEEVGGEDHGSARLGERDGGS